MTDKVAALEEFVRESFRAGITPSPLMTVSEWSDNYRFIPTGAEPGQWRTSRTPYLKSIMDDLSASSRIQTVVFMKGAQIGATEAGNNWIASIIDHTPSDTMMILPTLDMAKRSSKQRVAPMIQATPKLREKVSDSRSKDSGNTLLAKEFPGGILIMTGSNSAAGLRSMPARNLFLDEVDAYVLDVDGEGDPIDLAIRRTATYKRNRKIFLVSTPTVKDLSRIERAYHRTDMRYYFVPCPFCQDMQTIQWKNIVWQDKDPATTHLECEKCGGHMQEHHKSVMLEKGEWRSTSDGEPLMTGYHLSALYSPLGWYSWSDAVVDFLQAQDNREKLKTWTNTVLGETWVEEGETVKPHLLHTRREHYTQQVPHGVQVLTAGIDVQADRFEFEVVGWGHEEESWSITYRRLYGDMTNQHIWAALLKQLRENFVGPDGVLLNVMVACIDSGYLTDEVYKFCRHAGIRFAIPIKGASTPAKPIAVFPRKLDKTHRVYLTPVGTDTAKEIIYSRYVITDPGAGFCHWPLNEEYDEKYFEGVTAEKKLKKFRKGVPYFEWVKENNVANEPLDCRVYNFAAIRIAQSHFGVNLADPKKVQPLDLNQPKRKKRRRPPNQYDGWVNR